MKLILKVLAIAVVLALVSAGLFALWGDTFETLFSQERCIAWFSATRGYAWAIALGLLVSDLVLPVPATGIMAALGYVYGLVLGAALAALGSALAGVVGYGAARYGGKGLVRRLATEEELERFRGFFDRWGGWAIIISRALPILPEVMAILGGLSRMAWGRFLASLLLGTIPTALFYAWVGVAAREAPWYGLLIALALPMLLWPVVLLLSRKGRAPDRP